MTTPSKVKIKNFRKKIDSYLQQEIQLRKDIRKAYELFVLEVDDDDLALRHVRQAYFGIQKKRVQELMKERLKFHPFFSANSTIEEEIEEDDDGIL